MLNHAQTPALLNPLAGEENKLFRLLLMYFSVIPKETYIEVNHKCDLKMLRICSLK